MDTNLEIGGPRAEAKGRPLSAFRCSESVAEQPAKIRILVLDEQPLLRWGISAYLNSQPDMMVCGEAGSVSDARSKVAECHSQFVVTALRLGAGDVHTLPTQLSSPSRVRRIL